MSANDYRLVYSDDESRPVRRRRTGSGRSQVTETFEGGLRPRPRAVPKVSGKWARARKLWKEGILPSKNVSNRRWMHTLLNGHTKGAFRLQMVLCVLIIFNVLLFIIESEETIAEEYPALFLWGEGVSTAFFTIEYGLRVWVVPEHKRARYQHPVYGRLNYCRSFMAVIDILSIAPFYVEVIFDVDLPSTTALRIFRVFRVLKIEHYTNAMESIGRVFWVNREILVIGCAISLVFLLATATLIWFAEKDNDPENFGSIPKTIFLSVLMLTGQGIEYDGKDYGSFTRFSICLTAVVSVVLFTVPASMLTWGFENEAERLLTMRKERKKAKKAAERAGVEYVEPSTDSERRWSTSTSESEDVAAVMEKVLDDKLSHLPGSAPIPAISTEEKKAEVSAAITLLGTLPLDERAKIVAQILSPPTPSAVIQAD